MKITPDFLMNKDTKIVKTSRDQILTRSMTKRRKCSQDSELSLPKSDFLSRNHDKIQSLPPEQALQIANLQDKLLQPLLDQLFRTNQLQVLPDSTEITDDYLEKLEKTYGNNKHARLGAQVMADLPASYLAERRDVASGLNFTYSHTLDRHPYATNQQYSGRCWLFAALNEIRLSLMKEYNLPDSFELSQAYLFYYDKIERCNFLLEKMINLRKKNSNDIVVSHLLMENMSPIEDGGTWGFFKNLVLKYGLMPQTSYDECFNTNSTSEMNSILRKKVAQFTAEIRSYGNAYTDAQLRELKDTKWMPEIYKLVNKFMGVPPSKFDWSYYENTERSCAKKHKIVRDLTPLSFYATVVAPHYDIENKILLVHDPRSTTKNYYGYTTPHFANMVGGTADVLTMVSLDDLKQAAIASIKAQTPVWIACDVGKDFSPERGVLSTELFDYDLLLDSKMSLSKADQLTYRVSTPSHAMLLVGVDLDDKDCPSKWRIENSWGDGGYDPGYLMMTDKWFDQYMYYVVVDRTAVPTAALTEIRAHETDIQELDFNDPFGAVALK